MSNLEAYINKIKKYIEKNPNSTELEIIRYVYLDLGKKFQFDVNFMPFGNSKQRQHIYRRSENESFLEECMETRIITCKSVSHILEHILRAVGVNIRTIIDPNDCRKCPHVYNIIIPKEGESYSVDLQEDMYGIQAHSFTKNFGISAKDGKTLVIGRFEQEQIDKKIGYINDNNYYADDYLYLMKTNIDYFKNFGEKVRFVLENIDIYNNPNIQYTDRQWHHVRILEELFSDKEFDFRRNDKKIRIVDCYKDINNIRYYVNCISVQTEKGTEMYVYNKKKYQYCLVSLKNFAKAVQNGLVVHNSSVPGLNRALKELKSEAVR